MSLRIFAASYDPLSARWERPRRTLDTIREAGFDVGEIKQAELPGSCLDAALRERGRSPLSNMI
jgi:hypothetical protein